MTELERILLAYDDARRRGAAPLLATVFHVQGSTYRRPGARMLLTDDGVTVGTISGGCLEKEVHRKAWWLTASGRPTVVRYDSRSGEDAVLEFGLGCQGAVDVLFERCDDAHVAPQLELLRGHIRERRACVRAVVVGVEGAGAVIGDWMFVDSTGRTCGSAVLADVEKIVESARTALDERRSRAGVFRSAGGTVRVFIEAIVPPPHLLIVGAGHDAEPLARLAKGTGWDVTVADGRSAYANATRFPDADRVVVARPGQVATSLAIESRTVAVIMNHNYADDRAALRELLGSPARYIGILGPQSRTDALRAELPDDVASDPRVFAPIGLDIGAETPEEIALAIVAEIKAVLSGHPAGFLRTRGGPIHRPPLADGAMDELPTPARANLESAACPTTLPS